MTARDLWTPDGTTAVLTAALLLLLCFAVYLVATGWPDRAREPGRHRDGGLYFYPVADDGTLGRPRRLIAEPVPRHTWPPYASAVLSTAGTAVADQCPADTARLALPAPPIAEQREPGPRVPIGPQPALVAGPGMTPPAAAGAPVTAARASGNGGPPPGGKTPAAHRWPGGASTETAVGVTHSTPADGEAHNQPSASPAGAPALVDSEDRPPVTPGWTDDDLWPAPGARAPVSPAWMLAPTLTRPLVAGREEVT